MLKRIAILEAYMNTSFSASALLLSRCVIGQTIIFLLCDFYLSFSLFLFPRLISAAVDWMSTILPHGVALVRI